MTNWSDVDRSYMLEIPDLREKHISDNAPGIITELTNQDTGTQQITKSRQSLFSLFSNYSIHPFVFYCYCLSWVKGLWKAGQPSTFLYSNRLTVSISQTNRVTEHSFVSLLFLNPSEVHIIWDIIP